MDYSLIKEKLKTKLAEKNIEADHPMAKETTFRCGGKAALFVVADSLDELRFTLSVIKAFGAKWMMLGNGSNVLFTDKGYDGIVLKLGKEFSEVVIEGERITAGASVLLSYLSKLAAANSLTGLEFASGIPGSLGGGIFMNAGAEGDIYKYDADELDLDYRHSRFMASGEVIVLAELKLKGGNQEEIYALMDELTKKRKEKQPLSYPSAGSFFKRPEGYFAGALIEQSGLKGFSVGGAEVSYLHAVFIINKGVASASDVLELCKCVQDRVYEKFGVRLEPEVRIVGE